MIALTSRLNERDETIIQLQEELDAYDRIHRETEQIIEYKSLRNQQLEQLISDLGQEVPENVYPDDGYMSSFQPLHSQLAQERRYQSENFADYGEGQLQTMLTADEKVNELYQILEHQGIENQKMRMQIEQVGGDKITFVREKIDELVNREVKIRLNGMGNTS